MKSSFTLLRQAFELWSARNAFQHAGSLAFYTLFSLAPLLIILITIIGVVLGEEAATGEISAQIEELIGMPAAAAVEEAVRRSRIEEAGFLPTLLGGGALLFGATTVFAQLQSSLNQFWDVVARPTRSGIMVFIKTRLLSLGLVLIIGLLLLISFMVSMGLTALIRFAQDWMPVPALVVSAVDIAFSLLIVTVLFAMIFKVLPDVHLHWGDMWRGAFITAVLFVLGRYLISLYLMRVAPATAYGAAGSLVVVLFWVYYSALILFFGVAFTRAYSHHRGHAIVPKSTAVKVEMAILEEGEEIQSAAKGLARIWNPRSRQA
jgi:membrane protein